MTGSMWSEIEPDLDQSGAVVLTINHAAKFLDLRLAGLKLNSCFRFRLNPVAIDPQRTYP